MSNPMTEGLGPGHAKQDCPICAAKAATSGGCPVTCHNRLKTSCPAHRPEVKA